MSEPTNNVESLLTAILKNDSSYLVVPQSRVEELLLAIYKNGGGGGGGSDITRYEVEQMLLGKVDTKPNYSLISDSEIKRLAGVDNYDDKSIRKELGQKVEKENGYSLISNADYDNFKKLENYDDSELRSLINDISKSLESLVPNDRTIAGKKLDKNISVDDLLKALNLDKVNNTSDLDKPISNATQAALDTKSNKTFIEAIDNTTSVVTVPENVAGFAAISKISGKTVKDGEVLKSAPVKSVVSLGRNIFDKKVITTNGSFNISDGTIVTDTVNKTRLCGYVLIPTGISTIVMTGDTSWSGAYGHVFFDADKKFISTIGVATSDTKKVNVPSNARYIGISIYEQAPYDSRDTLQIEASSTATPYTSYNKTTVSIPQEILNLPDYGLGIVKSDGTIVANEVDFENGVYHRRVASVDLGTLTWTGGSSSAPSRFNCEESFDAIIASGAGAEGICGKLVGDVRVVSNLPAAPNNSFAFYLNKRIYVVKNEYASPSDLKKWLKDTLLVYTLATPEIIDISSILYPFAVESGGTIEFVNEHNLDAPNTVLYKKEVL